MGDADRNLEEQIRDVEGQIRLVEAQIRSVEQKNETVEERIEGQIRSVEVQIRSVEQKIERVEERIETSSDHQERARLQDEIKQLRDKEARLQDKEAQLRDEKKRLQDEKKQLRDKEAQLRDEKKRLQDEKKQLRDKEARLQDKEAQLRDEKKQLRGKEAQGLEGGMQIGPESGNPVERDHPLSQFVACLRDRHLQEYIIDAKSNSVIELPKGIVWLGDKRNFSNQLFMRPCYLDLLEAKEEYFKLNSRLSSVVYTGTPGIGKSHLCAFVVARKLIAGTVVFFESASFTTETKAVYRLHLAGGVHSVLKFNSSQVLDYLSPNENAVYIVDGVFAGFPGALLETQIFASPSQELFRPERKVWPHYLYLHTPLFDLEELQSMRSAVSAFQKVSKEDVDEWFMAAGGVARTVLKRASLGDRVQHWKAKAEKIIFKMEKEDIEKVVLGILDGIFSGESDTLFHWRVDEKYVGERGDSPEKLSMRRFKKTVLCLASAWVANELSLRFRFEKLVSVASLIMTTSKDLELAALRGYWFETLGHMMLSRGGKFKCRWLDTNDKFTLTLPQSVSYLFKSNEDASMSCQDDFSIYCVPVGHNQAAIDSLSSPFLFFQMASGPEHSINKDGMVRIMDAMKDKGRLTLKAESNVRGACDPRRPTCSVPVLVFCTTTSNFDSHYKTPQKFVQSKRKASEIENIQQAVLELPINLVDAKKLASQ